MDMSTVEPISWILLATGVVVGAVVMWLILRRRDAGPELTRLRQELQTEVERRSSAEAKLPRIDELDNTLRQRDRALAVFQDERTEHIKIIEGLERDLANERTNAAEKIALIDDAQKKLKEAVQALETEVAKMKGLQIGIRLITTQTGD